MIQRRSLDDPRLFTRKRGKKTPLMLFHHLVSKGVFILTDIAASGSGQIVYPGRAQIERSQGGKSTAQTLGDSCVSC